MELTGNFILVKPDQPEEKTTSGLYIPQTAQKQPINRGTIIKVGPGFPDEPMLAKVGEYILFQQHAGIIEEYEGVKHLIMKQNDKLAKLR